MCPAVTEMDGGAAGNVLSAWGCPPRRKLEALGAPDEDVRAVFDTPALLLGHWWLVPPARHHAPAQNGLVAFFSTYKKKKLGQ